MISGFLNINKPENITSHGVAQKLKSILGTRRIGHAGTLDPFATGVLVIAIDKSTKLMEYLVNDTKEYVADFILGMETDTHDRTGKQTNISKITSIPLSEIRTALKKFTGEIEQIPPMYSAIKIKGKKLYELARAGKEIEREARKITISELEIIEYHYPLLKVKINCSSGTYIRSLAHDIGKILGCGAYVNDLMRTKSGNFNIEESVPLEAITRDSINKYLIPSGKAIDLPSFIANPDQISHIKMGQPIKCELKDQRVIAIDPSKNILSILEKNPDLMYYPKKVLI